MADLVAPGVAARAHRAARLILSTVALMVAAAGVADAKIALRRATPNDNFFFHGNYSTVPFDPATTFGIQIWNCADGAMPTMFVARTPLIVCAIDPTGLNPVLANLVSEVQVPGGSCQDHGGSCYFRNRSASTHQAGVRYFRVRYARGGRGNRVWLDTYGHLSAAHHANMLILITIDGVPRAGLPHTFFPLRNGGWYSPF